MTDNQIYILAVDDKPQNLQALEAMLNSSACKVIRAGSGKEALPVLLKREVALILLDIHMPIMDGFETAAFIR